MKVPNSESLNTKLCKMRKMGHFCHCFILRFWNATELKIKSSQLHSIPRLPGSIQMVALTQLGTMAIELDSDLGQIILLWTSSFLLLGV